MCATKRISSKRSPVDRYADYAKIDESKVPEKFRHLVPYAKFWSIGNDEQRCRLMARTSLARKKALVDAVRPLWDELSAWCDRAHGFATPVPDEVVIFEMLFEPVAEAEMALYPPAPPPPPKRAEPEPPLTPEQKVELQGFIDVLSSPASGSWEHDAARVRQAIKKILAFWERILAQHSSESRPETPPSRMP
jgi:hypothetical protein